MLAYISLLPLLALLAPSTAIPLTQRTTTTTSTVTPEALIAIDPTAASCSGAQFPDECRTASQSAPFILQSFTTYGITCPHEKAALIALMMYESGAFHYNKNHWPGVAGQGTRNMQSPAFNLQYAQAVLSPAELAPVQSDPAALLDVLNQDDARSFASAAWFLTTQCSADVRKQLQTGTLDGWHAYLTTCIYTTVTDDRDAGWQKAHEQTGTGII